MEKSGCGEHKSDLCGQNHLTLPIFTDNTLRKVLRWLLVPDGFWCHLEDGYKIYLQHTMVQVPASFPTLISEARRCRPERRGKSLKRQPA